MASTGGAVGVDGGLQDHTVGHGHQQGGHGLGVDPVGEQAVVLHAGQLLGEQPTELGPQDQDPFVQGRQARGLDAGLRGGPGPRRRCWSKVVDEGLHGGEHARWRDRRPPVSADQCRVQPLPKAGQQGLGHQLVLRAEVVRDGGQVGLRLARDVPGRRPGQPPAAERTVGWRPGVVAGFHSYVRMIPVMSRQRRECRADRHRPRARCDRLGPRCRSCLRRTGSTRVGSRRCSWRWAGWPLFAAPGVLSPPRAARSTIVAAPGGADPRSR